MTGEEFKAIRVAMGLTQQQLGSLLGLKAQTIADLEHGRMVITAATARHLVAQYKLWEISNILKKGP